jgi:DNA-binding response OmpR family regulator
LRRRGSGLPVIIFSALEPQSTRARALANGADAYLTKPVAADELLACMRRLLVTGPAPDQPRPY